MFGDHDINFDLQLEKFGVETGALKKAAVDRIFRTWVEDWEEEPRKKNDCVLEAQLLEKNIKVLSSVILIQGSDF
jgi:hypothetical protein